MTTKPHHDEKDPKDHKAPEKKAAPVPERSYRDPACAEQGRHRPMCDCAGDARLPITK